MSRIRRHAVGYVGALCLLGVSVFYCAPLILSAAAPERRSVYPYPGWSLGQSLLPRAADLRDRIRPRRPARSFTASPQVPNDALHFDGIDDRVTFGPAPSLGVTSFTITRGGLVFSLDIGTRSGPDDDRARTVHATVQVTVRNP